jgi:integrase
MSLSEHKIPTLEIGRHKDNSDNPGLYIQITKNGASWLFRYDIRCEPRTTKNGRETDRRERWTGLGSYKDFTLKQARARAREKRQLLADGIDPLAKKQAEKAAAKVASLKAITFKEASLQYFNEQSPNWRSADHRRQFLQSLRDHVFPIIGALPVSAIDKGLVLKILNQPYNGEGGVTQRFWTAAPETASRVRGRMEKILGWAIGQDYRSGPNPATWEDNLDAILPAKGKSKPHPAMSYNDVSNFITELRGRNEPEAAELEFCILTAARSNEVIGAKWGEFTLDPIKVTTRDEAGVESTVMGPCWIVPGDRMKSNKRHRIPLSDRAVAILKNQIANKSDLSNLVFDGIVPGAMYQLLTKLMGYKVTIHGFRSTFRDWASAISNHQREAAEKALAHGVKDQTEASYWRDDMYDKRIGLMADWATFCGKAVL